MNTSHLAINSLQTINVWDTYARPQKWRKVTAVYLGDVDGWVSFLVSTFGAFAAETEVLNGTEHYASQDRWVVYSDFAENIVEKADCFHFVNTLGIRKNSFQRESIEGERYEQIARQAGLIAATE